jgi:hypothetical protein
LPKKCLEKKNKNMARQTKIKRLKNGLQKQNKKIKSKKKKKI